MKPARAAHLLVAVAAGAGIGIDFHDMVLSHPAAEFATRTIHFLSYFTILGNALVAAAAIGAARRRGPLHAWAVRPATRAALSVYILVVAVVYHLLLAGLHPLSPSGWWANLLVHGVAPAGWLLCWLLFAPHGGIDARAPARWVAFPLVYAGWLLVHGPMDGWYPYPFVNAAKLGYARVALNMALLGLSFAGLGYAFRWLDGRLARRRRPSR